MTLVRRDWWWAFTFAVIGFALGASALLVTGRLYFYQFFMPEMAYLACGGHFTHPETIPGPLLDFLAYRTDSVSCDALDLTQQAGPAGLFARGHLYLALVTSWLWRLSSLSYLALLPLICILYAAYVAGCFVLLRLFFPRPFAVAGGVLLTLSGSALTLAVYLRDFAKAPFFVWALVLLVLAMRATSLRGLLLWTASAGVLIGLGYGFRSDIVVLLPVGMALLLIGSALPKWWGRVGASILFAALALTAGLPVFTSGGGASGGLGAMMMEGATDPFNEYLDLGPTLYSWGSKYSDELTLSAIAADLGSASDTWIAEEGRPVYGFTQALSRSTEYVAGRADLFIADLATRALKAGGWILAFPALAEQSRNVLDPGGITVAFPGLLAPAYGLLGYIWIIPIGLMGAAAFMLCAVNHRPREALALLIGFGVLLGYTALQFSMRHLFHLEFMWVLGLLALVHVLTNPASVLPRMRMFLIGAAIFCGLVAVTYTALWRYQSDAMRQEIDALLQAPRQAIGSEPRSVDKLGVFTIPIPAEHLAIVSGEPDSMRGSDLPVAVQWQVVASVDRLVVSLGGEECPQADVPLSLEYEKHGAWQALDETIVGRTGTEATPGQVIIPAFYRATQHLAAISVPLQLASCVLAIERVNGQTRLPASFTAVLPPNWREHSLALPLF